jgi:hypothetical protein
MLLGHAFDGPTRELPGASAAAMSTHLRERVASRARRDFALLRQALGERVDAMTDGSPVDPMIAASHHAWVQVEQDGQWLDLDPSLPGAQPGETLTTADETLDAIPGTEHQTVTLRLTAETLENGALTQILVLERTIEAAFAADSQILLHFLPEESGGGLLGSVGPPTAYFPVLVVREEPQVGEAIPIVGGGGGLLGGSSDLELVGLFLDVVAEAPDQAPVERRRILLDRPARVAGGRDGSLGRARACGRGGAGPERPGRGPSPPRFYGRSEPPGPGDPAGVGDVPGGGPPHERPGD